MSPNYREKYIYFKIDILYRMARNLQINCLKRLNRNCQGLWGYSHSVKSIKSIRETKHELV